MTTDLYQLLFNVVLEILLCACCEKGCVLRSNVHSTARGPFFAAPDDVLSGPRPVLTFLATKIPR